jgi:hypothetical protein
MATLQIDITFEQLLEIIRQLSREERLIITRELAKEEVETKLTQLLTTFEAADLSLDTINEEVEAVRQQLYDRQKH